MEAGTVATVSTTLLTFLALIGYIRIEVRDLRRELRDEFHGELSGVRADLKRLDDRVYALAVAMNPPVEGATRTE